MSDVFDAEKELYDSLMNLVVASKLSEVLDAYWFSKLDLDIEQIAESLKGQVAVPRSAVVMLVSIPWELLRLAEFVKDPGETRASAQRYLERIRAVFQDTPEAAKN
jgi:hypothetical protein